jgi:hypothetical protein
MGVLHIGRPSHLSQASDTCIGIPAAACTSSPRLPPRIRWHHHGIGWCVVPLLWGERGLPVFVQKLHNWRVNAGMIHGLETDIIHKETIFVSGRGCCSHPAHVVFQVSSTGPETALKISWDPRLEVFSDLVRRGSASDSC